MIRENLLWGMMIDPMSGRIVKRDTIVGAAVKVVGGAVLIVGFLYIFAVLFHFGLQ